jgi:hypothetical protein
MGHLPQSAMLKAVQLRRVVFFHVRAALIPSVNTQNRPYMIT